MSTNHKLMSDLDFFCKKAGQNYNMRQDFYQLASLIVKQNAILSKTAAAMGVQLPLDETQVLVTLMAMQATGHSELGVIEFTAADYNSKHGFDGNPIELKNLSAQQAQHIMDILAVEPVDRGSDYAHWSINFDSQDASPAVLFEASAGDKLLINKDTGHVGYFRSHDNGRGGDMEQMSRALIGNVNVAIAGCMLE